MSSVYRKIKGGVTAPQGFTANAVSVGIKNADADRLDMALIYSEKPCTAAGTFTTNRVKAAPVRVSQTHMEDGDVRAILANSGNANACTGVNGIKDARRTAGIVGKKLGLKQSQVAVCSTGVIGMPLPMSRIEPKLPELVEGLDTEKSLEVAQAIMTSDTCHKQIAVRVMIDGVMLTYLLRCLINVFLNLWKPHSIVLQ